MVDKQKKRGTKPIGVTVLTVLCIVLVAVLLALFILSSVTDLFALGKENKQIEVNITEGMSSGQIANILKKQGVIDQSSTFYLYSSFVRRASNQFQAGNYLFNSNMGYDEIIIMLKSGNINDETVSITFFEGETLREIARKLEENKVCSAKEFIEATETANFDYEFLSLASESDSVFRRMEGYLYPDTYEFYVPENVNSVLNKFLKNFNNRVYEGIYDKILDSGYTLSEAITLASIIQEEAGTVEEMRHVSSVFHNRLNNWSTPRLQSDVTIFYVEDNIKPYMQTVNQPLYDAYNTYECVGLPAGPICSPGMDAILAAIEPDTTEDEYFVTDINGKYYYAKTFEEHEQNCYIAARVGIDHGTDTDV